jgi:uncharacterized protein YjiS (DUF1127 family)
MSTAQAAAVLRPATDATWRVFRSLASCWVALQEWRKRGRSQDELNSLSNRGLADIGFTRSEIDRVQGFE